ncbi:MAG: PEP-CTERM system histidine kinase PrsK, partial [Novosphingobium sp.]
MTHALGALTALIATAWIFHRRDRYGPAGTAIVASLFVTALWCAAIGVGGGVRETANFGEGVRNLCWLLATYCLFSTDGRHRSVSPIKPVVIVLALVEIVDAIAHATLRMANAPLEQMAFDLVIVFRLLWTVGGLVLVHNLYIGSSPQSRSALRWPAAGLGVLLAYDLNFYTIAYLDGGWSEEL